jgi:chromosome segregation ATPase
LALANAQAQMQKLKENTSIKIQDLETALEALQEKEQSNQKDIEEKTAKLKELNSQLVNTKRELDGSREQWTIAKNKYEFDLQQQQLEFESLQVEVTEKRQHVVELDARLTKTKEELTERETTVQVLEQKLREIESRVSNTNIDLIKQENAELQQYILQLESEMSGIRDQQVDVTIKEKELETIRAALEETRINASQFETQLITAKAELGELEARSESDVSTLIEELNSTAEREKALQTKLENIESTAKAAEGVVAVANEEKDLWERKYSLLREENEILKSNGAVVPQELANALTHVNTILEQASNQQIATVLELQGKNSTLQLEMNRQRVEHDTIQKQLTKSINSSEKNEAKATANASHVQTVQGELETTKRENVTLKAEVM